jgi:hypothetical protein
MYEVDDEDGEVGVAFIDGRWQHSGSARHSGQWWWLIPVETAVAGSRGDETVASDWPDRNGHANNGARRRRVGRRVASTCPTSSNRWAQAEEAVSDRWGRSQIISN